MGFFFIFKKSVFVLLKLVLFYYYYCQWVLEIPEIHAKLITEFNPKKKQTKQTTQETKK